MFGHDKFYKIRIRQRIKSGLWVEFSRKSRNICILISPEHISKHCDLLRIYERFVSLDVDNDIRI